MRIRLDNRPDSAKIDWETARKELLDKYRTFFSFSDEPQSYLAKLKSSAGLNTMQLLPKEEQGIVTEQLIRYFNSKNYLYTENVLPVIGNSDWEIKDLKEKARFTCAVLDKIKEDQDSLFTYIDQTVLLEPIL